MKQLMAEGMPVATLREIWRQRESELRAAVKVARDDGRAAFELLDEQSRITEIADVKERYQQIAADYLAGQAAGQNVLVVSPGNDERRALNLAIRELLAEHGHVREHGRRHQVLVRRDLTPAEIQHTGSYQIGDVLRAVGTPIQQRQGIGRHAYLTVAAINRRAQLLTLRTDDGHRIEACPYKWVDRQRASVEVFTEETRAIAIGDRLQFRHPEQKRGIANGEFATIVALTDTEARLRFEGEWQRELTLPLSAMRHVDYGYAVTSFSSQGSTVDRVIVNDDSMRSARLVNREQLYVSISRGRVDARVYTDDAEALRLSVARDPKKAIALEAIKVQPVQQIKPEQKIIVPQPRQSSGMRM